MRLFTVALFGLFFAALAGARFLPDPHWLAALYLCPLLLVLFATGLAGSVLEHLLGPGFRGAAPVAGLGLAAFCVLFAVFERAPGTLGEGLPLSDLPGKAASIAALGAGLGALVLAIPGLRAPWKVAQALSGLTFFFVLFGLGHTARAMGVPFLSPLSLSLLGAAGLLFLIAAGDRAQVELPGDLET